MVNSCRLYYSGSNYIDIPVKRWDEGNWNITVETFVGSGNRETIFSNVTPGAVRELYNILGTPEFIDTTYNSGNTLVFEPIHGYGLSSLRQRRKIAVKNISDTFLNPNYFNIKIEGYRIDLPEDVEED